MFATLKNELSVLRARAQKLLSSNKRANMEYYEDQASLEFFVRDSDGWINVPRSISFYDVVDGEIDYNSYYTYISIHECMPWKYYNITVCDDYFRHDQVEIFFDNSKEPSKFSARAKYESMWIKNYDISGLVKLIVK